MKHIKDFQNEPLRDMVAIGAIDAHWARLWVRSDRPGALIVRWWRKGEERYFEETRLEIVEENERDNTCSVQLPPDFTKGGRLIPLCRYGFRVTRLADGHILGEGSFETAPGHPEQTPSRFSIALMSCHQPFTRKGAVAKKAVQMLRAANHCMRQHNTKFVLMVGDQMYSDYPKSLSLFDPDYFSSIAPPGRRRVQDCSPSEVRRLYQRRYRHFWNLPDWQALHREFPCYLILDDHEMIDNWGSDPAHQSPQWRAVGEGARMACFDYQASRVLPATGALPDNFHYSFAYGHTATFVMDLRSNRKAGEGGQLYSDAQERNLQDFLHGHRHKKILLIVLSVPAVHLPRQLAKLVARLPPSDEDFSDRWSSGAHVRDRDRFLRIIYRHQRLYPRQHLVLLSGDIHIGCVHQILWRQGGPPLYQMISSGITHSPGFLIQTASALSIRLNRSIATLDNSLSGTVRLFKGIGGCAKNPYDGLNLGIIEIETSAPGAEPKVQFLLYGHQKEHPVCVYRSARVSLAQS